jgi:chemotaxis protein MotB
MAPKIAPIIVIKKKVSHGGHHGGAWKVAYADFVTAMMALFIVLWLLNQSEQVKKAVAGYFNDPKGTANLLGTTMSGTGVQVTVDDPNKKLLEQLKEKLEQEIRAKKELEKLLKQIEITITPEGLRIELLESKNGTFYQSGSAQLSASGQALLTLLATELKTLPNQLLIEGHTDAQPYSSGANYTNWELSADRANSARRLLQQSGVRVDQVTQVRGYADQFLRVKDNPLDPSNRRISILVKNTPIPAAVPAHAQVVEGLQPQPSTAPANSESQVKQPETAKPGSAAAAQPKSGLMSKMTALIPGKAK